jgi:hypothetical protein
MKKTILPFYQSTFTKAFVSSVLLGMLFIQPVIAMPTINGGDYLPSVETSPEKLRAVSYIMQNSLVIKVQFENPAQEKIILQIINSQQEVVYTEHLGKREIFIGKYNLQELPNDRYTLVIKSASNRYSTSFSLQTSIKREVNIQETEVSERREYLRGIPVF